VFLTQQFSRIGRSRGRWVLLEHQTSGIGGKSGVIPAICCSVRTTALCAPNSPPAQPIRSTNPAGQAPPTSGPRHPSMPHPTAVHSAGAARQRTLAATQPAATERRPMTPTQIELIRTSWAAVEPIADVAATLFYERLFEQDPAVRRLFRKTDMAAQKKNLMQTLTVVVKGIDRLDDLVPAVEALGRRHAGYGVRPEHYDIVGAALLWTLEQGLGDAFTNDVRDAWAEAYGTLAAVMIAAAEEPLEAAA
jgi:hemoglobin-like flavoprotein